MQRLATGTGHFGNSNAAFGCLLSFLNGAALGALGSLRSSDYLEAGQPAL